jgi:hypothetical protein
VISTIIFSKDRAFQLDFLLTSLAVNSDALFDVNILYDYSSDDFKNGYEKLISKHPSLNWIKEEDFQEDTTNLVDNASEFVCFFVDDNILYSELEISLDHIKFLFDQKDIFCLSLRLGTNTIIQNEYRMGEAVLPTKGENLSDTFLVWDYTAKCDHCRSGLVNSNFGYPFSVDGHIYRKELLKRLLGNKDDFAKLKYDSPNGFEGGVFTKGWDITSFPKSMASLKKSVVVNTPLNLVGSSENMAGQVFGVSLEELNKKFLEGSDPDLDRMDFSNVYGCHQEIQLKFKEVADVRSS